MIVALTLFLLQTTLHAGPGVDLAGGFDPLAIEWVLPGHFEEARARSKQEQRLLLIKGVSFGIDEAGAACATQGEW